MGDQAENAAEPAQTSDLQNCDIKKEFALSHKVCGSRYIRREN